VRKMIFVDSNIWCYYFDARLPEHIHVREPLRSILATSEVVTNTVVVMEVAHYLARSFGESEAREKIKSFIRLRNMNTVNFDRSLLNTALEFLAKYAWIYGLGGRDSTILATLQKVNIPMLFTHDRSLATLAHELGVEIKDPVPWEI